MPPFIRSPYNYDLARASDEAGLECKDPSLAQQQFRDDSDINVIVARFGLDPYGPMPTETPGGLLVDFSQVGDYRTCLDSIRAADAAFAAFPANVRSRFANDPSLLISFLEDDSNRDEAIRLGLVPAPLPLPVQPVQPTP